MADLCKTPPLLPDSRTHRCMMSTIGVGRCVVLYWPKDATLRDLQHCEEVVHFQLAIFIKDAQRKEAADAEYASWFAPEATAYDSWFIPAPKD